MSMLTNLDLIRDAREACDAPLFAYQSFHAAASSPSFSPERICRFARQVPRTTGSLSVSASA